MFRSLRALISSYRLRLISMGMIFAVVVLIITMVEQIILNIDIQIANETKPIVWADLTIDSQSWWSDDTWTELNTLITSNDGQALRVTEFYTTLQWATEPKLAQVKGIEPWYPRYGELSITDLSGNITNGATTTLSWWVWIDPQTYELISKANTIRIGEITLPVLGIITTQASLWFNFLDEGRTILMPYDLIQETNLTQFWSRIDHEVQIKTKTDAQASTLSDLIESTYGDLYRPRLASSRVEQLNTIIEQLDQYTSIILIITIILSLLIMATASMTMTLKIKSSIAIMRVLGITRLQTVLMTTLLFGSIFLIWGIIGVSVAYIIFSNIWSLIPLAADFVWIASQLNTIIWIAIVSFIIAARQPISLLTLTHPLALLKQSGQASGQNTIFWVGIIAWGAWLILSLLNNNPLISLAIVIWGGIVLWGGYRLLMKGFGMIYGRSSRLRSSSFSRFDASRQTVIPGNQTGLLVGGLSSALVAFCLIVALSLSFIQRLDTSAVDQPNLFVLNVRNEDITPIKALDPNARLYDTILWRISTIDNLSLTDHLNKIKQEPGEFTREFNITTRPLDNSPIISGTPLTTGGVSLDQDFAKRLGVWVGTRMSLFIQWRSFDLTVTSLRKSIRTGAEPFFFLQLDANEFAQAPKSWFWITRQPQDQLPQFKQIALNDIGTHLSFIDITDIINLVSDISNKIITIIIICMGIIITLLLLLSIASNEASALVMRQTYRLYHIIGMTKSQLSGISQRVGAIYGSGVIVILLMIVPLLLRFIYNNASILTRSWTNLVPLLWGIGITIAVMMVSYRWFHRLIIKKL